MEIKKHIKKKFINERVLTKEEVEQLSKSADEVYPISDLSNDNSLLKSRGTLLYDGNIALDIFSIHHQGQDRPLPQPDPVLVFFDTAYLSFRLIPERRQAVLNKALTNLNEDASLELYNFYGSASTCVILLFSALEAFVNKCIPKDWMLIEEKPNRFEGYNKPQIEKSKTITEKINKVLKVVYKKDFQLDHGKDYAAIINLKDLRNSFVHLQQSEGDKEYEVLYQKALDFDYGSAMNAIAKFCNYYSSNPNYIESCPCSHDW